MLAVGDVFSWESYSHQRDGEIKRRWFVCLGEVKEDPLETNSRLIQIVASTTTTQTEYYLPGDHRAEHPIVWFKESERYGFTADCLLDLGLSPEIWLREEVESGLETEKIRIKGHLPDLVMRGIYEKICASRSYSPCLKKQIQFNFRQAGISGLSDPQERHRR